MAELIRLDDPSVIVRLHRSARARRFTLSLRDGSGEARLTAPVAACRAETVQFLERHRGWLRAALDRVAPAEPVAIGAVLPVAGVSRRLEAGAPGVRACRLDADRLVLPHGRAAGPAVAAFLKVAARAALVPAVQSAATALGRPLGAVSLRDTRSRWGSCTARGDVMFSWRLAMAPPPVLAYVAIHEAAHLAEMNHGPRFWAHVERLCPDWRTHRAWLRRHGPALHRFAFAEAPC